jgi:hypothetical protein
MAASAWANSRKTAEELKDGAIGLRGPLLDEKIPAGTMDPVLAQCKAMYLVLEDIFIAPATKDLDPEEDLENLILMKNAVLAFHKELWKLMTISDQLTRTPGALDQVLLREQRADIVDKLLGAISTYLRLLPVFSELAGRDWPASPEVNDETPGKATA